MHEVVMAEQQRRISKEDDGVVFKGSSKTRLSNIDSDLYGVSPGVQSTQLHPNMFGNDPRDQVDTNSSLLYTQLEFNPNRRTTMQ
jgi:hypothetical protein